MLDKKYASLNTLKIFLDNLRIVFAKKSHTHTKDEITDISTNISQFDNDSGYLTVSNIPIMLKVEEWEFTIKDNDVVKKTIATVDLITNEELIFELEDGSLVTKKVVVN